MKARIQIWRSKIEEQLLQRRTRLNLTYGILGMILVKSRFRVG